MQLGIELVRDVNPWAVMVAGVATFVLGGIWYSPMLFENVSIRAHGYGEAEQAALRATLVPSRFAAALAAYVAMAAAFALLASAAGVEGLGGGLALGALLWVGFVVTAGLTTTLFSPRPLEAWAIDAGFQLCFLLGTGALLGVWR